MAGDGEGVIVEILPVYVHPAAVLLSSLRNGRLKRVLGYVRFSAAHLPARTSNARSMALADALAQLHEPDTMVHLLRIEEFSSAHR